MQLALANVIYDLSSSLGAVPVAHLCGVWMGCGYGLCVSWTSECALGFWHCTIDSGSVLSWEQSISITTCIHDLLVLHMMRSTKVSTDHDSI